jgi:Prephenate dehydratase
MERKFDQNIHKVGTLGPQGTSSEQAAIHFVQKTLRGKGTIVLKDTFEEVFTDLTEGTVDYAIVPVAYPGINQFYMTQYIEDI